MDEISNGVPTADDDADLEVDDDLTWGHPATLGLTGLVLAILSLWGGTAFRGVVYTQAFASGDGVRDLNAGVPGYVVAGAYLTAVFALIPLALARRGLGQLVGSDDRWIGHVLRAALLLSVLSVGLHVAQALVLMSLGNGTSFPGLYF